MPDDEQTGVFKDYLDAIEPLAQFALLAYAPELHPNHMMVAATLSSAISSKRIADALERIEVTLHSKS